MKKLFLMLAVVGSLTFASCSADKETQAKQEEANKNVEKEAGEMPTFDDEDNEVKQENKKEETPAPKTDSTAKTEETKVEKP